MRASPSLAANASFLGHTDALNDTARDEEDIFRRNDVRVGLIFAYSVVFCCCFFGNLLVVIVVVMHRRMRTVTNFFLTNLAVADLCVGVFCVYQNLSIYLMDEWPFGDFLCRMYFFVQALSYTASVGILTVICVERYIAIVHPMWSKQVITLRRLRIVVVVVWLISACFCSPRLFMCGTEEVPSHAGDPVHLCIMRRFVYDSKTYDVLNFLVCFFLPLVVMSVMYFIIGLKLWRSSILASYAPTFCGSKKQRSRPQNETDMEMAPTSLERCKEVRMSVSADVLVPPGNDQSAPRSSTAVSPLEICSDTETAPLDGSSRRRRSKRRRSHITTSVTNQIHHHYQQQAAATILRARRKVIRLLVAVVVGFAVCNLPFHARKLYQYWSSRYDGASRAAVTVTIVTTLILYMNSFINPILYAFLSDNFRKSMKDVLLCRARKTARRLSSNRSNGRTTASSLLQHDNGGQGSQLV